MSILNLITQLENNLRAAVEVHPSSLPPKGGNWELRISLFYNGEPAGHTSFNLHGYDEEEAIEVAKNIKQNDFIMKEIDDYLWGEMD